MGMLFRIVAAVCAALSVAVLARMSMDVLNEKRLTAKRVSLDDVLADRTLCLVLFLSAGVVVSFAVSVWLVMPCALVSVLLSRRVPVLLMHRKKERLRSSCDGQLDTLADIIAMGVRAGLSFDAALDLYCEKFSGALSAQMNAARAVWKSGIATREKALTDLASRIDSRALKRFSETVVQAIAYGSPLAELLSNFADELREQRHASIEQQVAKAPVKMFLPLGACILPAMLVLVMGPVALQFLEAGI